MPFYTPNTVPSEIDLRLLDYLRREFAAVGQGQDTLREQYEDVIQTNIQAGQSARIINHDHSRLLQERGRAQQANFVDYYINARFSVPDSASSPDITIDFRLPDGSTVSAFQTFTHMNPIANMADWENTVSVSKAGNIKYGNGDLHATSCVQPDTGLWNFNFTSTWRTDYGGTYSNTLIAGANGFSLDTFPVQILVIGTVDGQYAESTSINTKVVMRDLQQQGRFV